jgi:hypothetical protein
MASSALSDTKQPGVRDVPSAIEELKVAGGNRKSVFLR